MKNKTITPLLCLLFSMGLFSPSVAQNKQEKKVIIKQLNGADISTFDSFDVKTIDEAHQKLDSIFKNQDKDLHKKIMVMVYKMDSLNSLSDKTKKHENITSENIDSAWTKRVEAVLKDSNIHSPDGSKDSIIFVDGTNAEKIEQIEIITDTIIDGEKTIIKKRIQVSKDSKDGLSKIEKSRISIKELHDVEGKGDVVFSTSTSNEEVRIGKAKLVYEDGETKPLIQRHTQKSDKITIDEIELLKMAGVPIKYLLETPLIPDGVDIKRNIKVIDENTQKTITINTHFNNKETIEYFLVDRNGGIVAHDKQKGFMGDYKQQISLKEMQSPYLFIIVRGQNIFGKKFYY